MRNAKVIDMLDDGKLRTAYDAHPEAEKESRRLTIFSRTCGVLFRYPNPKREWYRCGQFTPTSFPLWAQPPT